MPDLLLELFSEEIPARMQARAADDLKKMITDKLVEAGLRQDRKSTRLNSSHSKQSRMPSSA